VHARALRAALTLQRVWRGNAVRQLRAALGLPVDRPVIMTGHQAGIWHAGIAEKFVVGARMAAAHELADHPRIVVTGLEAQIGTRYTYDTSAWLTRRCPGVRFVWIMGADNLAGFHRWQHWRDIAALVPIAVIDRPGSTLKATNSPAGAWLAPHRLDETDGPLLAQARAPAFVFIHAKRSDLSSTELRRKGKTLSPGY
jgi:nicotinate-nucleotide adenylyltransferase